MSVKCLPQKKDYKLGGRKIKNNKDTSARLLVLQRQCAAAAHAVLCAVDVSENLRCAGFCASVCRGSRPGACAKHLTHSGASLCRILQKQWQQHSS